ncbi:expressed unknown protein [Seminavis robusta]|uniref:MYND-type domain-containing protein n=1 Tax=Seminavis robusta TaxID=568900 RepID=A0A9N8HQV3_9STRA|nr:expressed unknown protein [Seminavis robusta]|eukprot:Sro1198_g251620.1 n/a (488) ;mRNA; f:20334-21797
MKTRRSTKKGGGRKDKQRKGTTPPDPLPGSTKVATAAPPKETFPRCLHGRSTTTPPDVFAKQQQFLNELPKAILEDPMELVDIIEKKIWKHPEAASHPDTVSLAISLATDCLIGTRVKPGKARIHTFAAIHLAHAQNSGCRLEESWYDSGDEWAYSKYKGQLQAAYYRQGHYQKDAIRFMAKRIPCQCLNPYKKFLKKISDMGSCDNCGETFDRKRLRCCSLCRVFQYCSRECQVSNWKEHEFNCKLYRGEEKFRRKKEASPNLCFHGGTTVLGDECMKEVCQLYKDLLVIDGAYDTMTKVEELYCTKKHVMENATTIPYGLQLATTAVLRLNADEDSLICAKCVLQVTSHMTNGSLAGKKTDDSRENELLISTTFCRIYHRKFSSKRDMILALDRRIPCDCLNPIIQRILKEPETKVCFGCQKEMEEIYTCDRCMYAPYCSRTCQEADWPKHEMECNVHCGKMTCAEAHIAEQHAKGELAEMEELD